MKRALRAVALLAAIAAPAVLSAQTSERAVGLGVSGGLSLPLGDFGEGLSSGYNITGHLYFKPAALTSLRLRADVGYDRFDIDGGGGNQRMLSFAGNALYDFPTQSTSLVRPYVLGGLGIYNTKFNADGPSALDDATDTNLGLQVGGGLTFQLSGFSTFAEARFVNVFGDGGSARFVPIVFGVRF
jgi:opacity protein-like surface antigen